jgi:signal transduction histidine kinase
MPTTSAWLRSTFIPAASCASTAGSQGGSDSPGRNWSADASCPSCTRRNAARLAQAAIAGARLASTYEAEHRLRHQNGSDVWALVIVNLLRDTMGKPARFMALVLDIRQRKAAELELAEREEQLHRIRLELEQRVERRTVELASANSALLNEIADRRVAENQVRDLLVRLVQGVEDERGRISRDLHDTLGQHLAMLAIGLKALEDDVGKSPHARERLAKVQNALRNVEDQLDRIAYELRPTALDDLGLEEAMRSHVERWSQESGVEAELHTHGLRTGRLTPTVESTVYRVVQEALTNVHKHAHASRVGVIIERRLERAARGGGRRWLRIRAHRHHRSRRSACGLARHGGTRVARRRHAGNRVGERPRDDGLPGDSDAHGNRRVAAGTRPESVACGDNACLQ